ncbi:S8 family serine peptidase [Myxococcota bacterium]|nr:S8 family serine peptidase [Myxococcota bacterium]
MRGSPLLGLLPLLSWTAACGPAAPGEAPVPGASTPPGQGLLVVDLVDGTSLDEARARTGLDLRWATARSEDEALAVVEVADLPAEVARLEQVAGVEAVEPSVTMEALGLVPTLRYPDDPLYAQQWNLRTVDAPAGWRAGGGVGVTVAVVDTGVSRVPDLGGTVLLEGVSFVPGRGTADDDNGHGTHVAGTIAQTTNNGLGVAGVAPRARILPLKALSGAGFGQSEWIASAIDEAADQGAQVINLSLGGGRSKVIEVAVQKAAERGVLVVAAAGNSGREGVGWPARSPHALGVSATGPDDTLAPYSTWGEGVDLSAPGGDKRKAGGGILQDTVDGGKDGHAFKELQGTSMATPHVAGAAAVLLGAGAGSPAHVRALLDAGAVDLGEPGPDPRYGQGRLDVGASLRRLLLVERPSLAALGAGLAFALASFGGMRRKGLVAATAAAVAGGLFFLPLLPLPPATWLDLLGRPLLSWPHLLGGARLASNPLWLSAALPALLTFVAGPTRAFGWLAAGVSAGVGAHLLHGAVTGSLDPLWLSGAAGTGWLAVNGVLCLLFTVAVAGVDRLDRQRRA